VSGPVGLKFLAFAITARSQIMTDEQIRIFSTDPENIMKFLALLKVGSCKGDAPERIAILCVADILFRFREKYLSPNSQN
jgi:hypothetical protein